MADHPETGTQPVRPQQHDLTSGPVAKTLFLFALPALATNILQSINGTINSIYVGQFLGETALAATSNATMIMFLMFSTLFGFAMAATIMVGQAMGRRDVETVRRTIGTAVGVFMIAGAATATLGWLFAPSLLRIMATPADAYPYALSYLRVIFLGMPMSFLMILLSASLRGVGDAVTPLRNTVLNVALDVALNPIFILGLGPFPKMGIAGSAFATLLAGLISITVLIIRIYRMDATIRLRGPELRWLKPNMAFLKPIVSMGFPMGLSMIIMSGSSLVMLGLVNREGVDTTAAFGVMNQLWNYVQMPAVAVGSAVSAMVAQNIGAQKWDRIDHIAKAGVGINVLMTAALVAIITLATRQVAGLFLPGDSPAIEIAIHLNHIVGWTFIMMGIGMVLTSVVRANGAVVFPLISLIISAIFVRLGVGFGFHDQYGAEAIWWAFVAGGIVSLIMSVGYYLYGGWRKKHILPADEEPVAAE